MTAVSASSNENMFCSICQEEKLKNEMICHVRQHGNCTECIQGWAKIYFNGDLCRFPNVKCPSCSVLYDLSVHLPKELKAARIQLLSRQLVKACYTCSSERLHSIIEAFHQHEPLSHLVDLISNMGKRAKYRSDLNIAVDRAVERNANDELVILQMLFDRLQHEENEAFESLLNEVGHSLASSSPALSKRLPINGTEQEAKVLLELRHLIAPPQPKSECRNQYVLGGVMDMLAGVAGCIFVLCKGRLLLSG